MVAATTTKTLLDTAGASKFLKVFANEIIKEGGEGAIYKHLDATWKHGTSTSQFKIKRRFEAELRVLGWDYGDKGKKHEHRIWEESL